jgi:hypothetical protein
MHMTFGRLGAVDRQAKMSGMEGALPATWRLPPLTWRVVFVALSLTVLVFPTVLYVAQLPRLVPIAGTFGDWHYLSLVDPASPYARDGYYRWAPIAAYLWQVVAALGYWPWIVLHFAAALAFANRRMSVLVLISFPFWRDMQDGSVMIFVLLAAWWALRGSRAGIIAYCMLFALMPRPLMVPVLAWLVWKRTDARWVAAVCGFSVIASSLALEQLGPWVTRLMATGPAEIASLDNIGPSALIGTAWVPIGAVLAVVLTWKGRLGLASLAASPYWLPYYLLMGLLELHRDVQVVGREASDLVVVEHADHDAIDGDRIGSRAAGGVPDVAG